MMVTAVTAAVGSKWYLALGPPFVLTAWAGVEWVRHARHERRKRDRKKAAAVAAVPPTPLE
jgi:hypothetical protein